MEGKGIPISVTVDGVNRHDMKMTPKTLENIVIDMPEPTTIRPQNTCRDKAYDFPGVKLLEKYGYTAHMKSGKRSITRIREYRNTEPEEGLLSVLALG